MAPWHAIDQRQLQLRRHWQWHASSLWQEQQQHLSDDMLMIVAVAAAAAATMACQRLQCVTFVVQQPLPACKQRRLEAALCSRVRQGWLLQQPGQTEGKLAQVLI